MAKICLAALLLYAESVTVGDVDARDFSVRPAEFTGTPKELREEIRRQNEIAFAYGATPVRSELDLFNKIISGQLVRVEGGFGRGFYLDPNIGDGYLFADWLRYARPWVAEFIHCEGAIFAREHSLDRREKPSSLVRTPAWQREVKKQRGNGNAAAHECRDPLDCSPHLTGSVEDKSKLEMSDGEIAWMRRRLLQLFTLGWVRVIEEHNGNAFHVFVHPAYICEASLALFTEREIANPAPIDLSP